MGSMPVQLWSDEPSPVDLLAFDAVADTAVEAILDDALDPVAIGISGSWGSGKSTVLNLIKAKLRAAEDSDTDARVLVVETDPWRYDPDVGAKATLILEILNALTEEVENQGPADGAARGNLKKLVARVNWAKALKLAARSSITLQLPRIDDLTGLINSDDEDGQPEPRNLDEFRTEFGELLADEHLGRLRRVVVLVDDLDRCLPTTVVETLETMRLFLSVPKMSFVIAADEERVADALRVRYDGVNGSAGDAEEPARLYLHKIVQTTFRLPALSRFDTEAYLLLLLLQRRATSQLTKAQFEQILEGCTETRVAAGSIDSISIPEGLDLSGEMQFAARLTPILYEKLRGNPRRVKRFLNDLNVRSSIAERRGIELNAAVVAKLMVLELLLPDEFDTTLDWLARGELRHQLSRLEDAAGRPAAANNSEDTETQENGGAAGRRSGRRDHSPADDEPDDESEPFNENLLRWAKLQPSLGDIDLSPYLHLAAAFASLPLVDLELPERLRDVAANLLSSSRAAQKSVTDADIRNLTTTDASALIEHLGRMARDRPGDLISSVDAILRVARLTDATQTAASALLTIPAQEIRAPVVLLFDQRDAATYRAVLESWNAKTAESTVNRAIAQQLESGVAD